MSDIGDKLWGSADGKKTKIRDLAIDHLVNILNWVNDPDHSYSEQFVADLEQYATDLKFINFAKKEPYPQQQEDGSWVVVDPTTGEVGVKAPPAQYIKKVKKKLRKTDFASYKKIVDRWGK